MARPRPEAIHLRADRLLCLSILMPLGAAPGIVLTRRCKRAQYNPATHVENSVRKDRLGLVCRAVPALIARLCLLYLQLRDSIGTGR